MRACFKESGILIGPSIERGADNLIDIEDVFMNCIKMKEVNFQIPNIPEFSDDVPTFTNNIFYNCINLNKYDYSLNCGSLINCFYNCSSLSSVGNISSKWLNNTFNGCSNLKFINIDSYSTDSFESILPTYIVNTFNRCSNINTINLNNVDFSGSNFMTFRDLNKNAYIKSIGKEYDFIAEQSIRSTLMDLNYAYYESDYFNSDLFIHNTQKKGSFYKYNVPNIEESLILQNRFRIDPHNVQTELVPYFEDNCFKDSKINSVTYMGDSLNIGNYCFNNSTISSFYAINTSLPQKIGVFYNCSNLNSVTFKGEYTDIPDFYFYNCPLTMPDLWVKNIEINAFYNMQLEETYRIRLYSGSLYNDLKAYGFYIRNDSTLYLNSYSAFMTNAIKTNFHRDFVSLNKFDNSWFDSKNLNINVLTINDCTRYDSLYHIQGVNTLNFENLCTDSFVNTKINCINLKQADITRCNFQNAKINTLYFESRDIEEYTNADYSLYINSNFDTIYINNLCNFGVARIFNRISVGNLYLNDVVNIYKYGIFQNSKIDNLYLCNLTDLSQQYPNTSTSHFYNATINHLYLNKVTNISSVNYVFYRANINCLYIPESTYNNLNFTIPANTNIKTITLLT